MKKGKLLFVVTVIMMLTAAFILAGCMEEAVVEDAVEEAVEEVEEEPFVIGFTNWTVQDTFCVSMQEGMVEAAEENGAEILVYDNEGGKEVDNTRTLISKGVDAAIMCYWDPNLAKTSIDLLTAENIPVIAVDVPMPGIAFTGVNNYDVGYQGGEYLAQWIIDNWDGELDLLIVLNSPTEGPIVAQRFQGQEDALLEKIDYPKDEIEYADCGGWAEGALNAARPILAKYPDAEKIAFVVENDPSVLGIITALEEAGKIDNAVMVTQGVAFDIVHLVRKGELPVVGGVAYLPEKYGEQSIPKLIEVIKLVKSGVSMEEAYKQVIKDDISNPDTGEVLGQAIYVKTDIVTSDNIDEYYPE